MYIIPASILQDLKELAYEDVKSASPALPKIDLSTLIKDAEGQEVTVINSIRDESGVLRLDSSGTARKVWSIKEGLQENVDFQFISEEGWNKIVEW